MKMGLLLAISPLAYSVFLPVKGHHCALHAQLGRFKHEEWQCLTHSKPLVNTAGYPVYPALGRETEAGSTLERPLAGHGALQQVSSQDHLE